MLAGNGTQVTDEGSETETRISYSIYTGVDADDYDEEDYVLIRTDGTTESLSADKFQFNKCLRNTNEKIKLNELQLDYLAENINSQGLEFNTRYVLSLTIKTQDSDDIKLDSMRLNTTNYISSNMADSEKKEIKNLLISDLCKSINNYAK